MRFTVETREAGIVIERDGSVVRCIVYSPLDQIGRRGGRVNRHHMELHCSPDDHSVNWAARCRLVQPTWSAGRVVTYVLSVMREASERSIAAGHPYPTEFFGPLTRQLKGVDSTIPDPSSVDDIEDRRGRDVVVRFTKPMITIVSLSDARDAQRSWERERIEINWYHHQRVGRVVEELTALRGLDEVARCLRGHNIPHRRRRESDEILAKNSVAHNPREVTMNRKVTNTTAAPEVPVSYMVQYMSHKLIQYDAAQSKREAKRGSVNVYRMGLLLKALQDVERKVASIKDSRDPGDFEKLRAKMNRGFNDFPPLRQFNKALDRLLQTGKRPKITAMVVKAKPKYEEAMNTRQEKDIIRTLCNAGKETLAKSFARSRGYGVSAATFTTYDDKDGPKKHPTFKAAKEYAAERSRKTGAFVSVMRNGINEAMFYKGKEVPV